MRFILMARSMVIREVHADWRLQSRGRRAYTGHGHKGKVLAC